MRAHPMRIPGAMVATKRSLMETPAVEPKRMSGMLGGIMMPRQPEVEFTAVANSLG